MGAVGSNITTQSVQNNDTSTSLSVNKKAQKITDYFKQRTFGKLDISPYLKPQYDGKGYITIDYARMPGLAKQLYNQIVQEVRIESTDYGAWGKWIKLKR